MALTVIIRTPDGTTIYRDPEYHRRLMHEPQLPQFIVLDDEDMLRLDAEKDC